MTDVATRTIHRRRRISTPDYLYTHRLNDALVPVFEELFFVRGDYDAEFLRDNDRFQMAMRLGYGCMEHFGARLKAAKASRHYPEHPPIVEAGNRNFTWRYAPSLLNPDSVVLCFGVGSDISFETALAETAGCTVWCFDPTPGGIRHATSVAAERSDIRFMPWGVGGRDEIVTFYGPRDDEPGSLSEANLRGGGAKAQGQLHRLDTILTKLGKSRIDLLKLDIEGSEYDAIDIMLSCGVEVDQLCVEFDQPVPPWRTERCIDALQSAGFWLIDVWGLNALLIHQRMLD